MFSQKVSRKKYKMIDLNALRVIQESLKKMALYKSVLNEEHSSRAYDNAAKIVVSEEIVRRIITGKSLPRGIGPKIREFIIEIISLGYSKELSAISKDPRIIALESLQKVIGIGPVTAIELISAGYTSIDSLKGLLNDDPKGLLNDTQKIGVKYYDKILERIPRDLVTSSFEEIKRYIPSDSELTGSYRRKKSTSGDLDILVRSNKMLAKDISVPNEIVLSAGPQKKSFLWSPSNANGSYVQVDIFVTDHDSYVAYLNYSTGPFEHNIKLRSIAAKKGMRLNQYGLFGTDGKKILLNTEADLYKALGLPYVEPWNR